MSKETVKSPRTIWRGSIGWGMVSVPIGLYTVADDKRTGLTCNLHAECGNRLRAPRYCPNCNKNLEAGEKVLKGFEIAKDTYVPLTEEEMDSVKLDSVHNLQIEAFVPADFFEPTWFAGKDSYFIGAQEVGAKAFTLLLKGMEQANVIAFTKVAIRDREQLCVVRSYKGVMILQTIHYADELRDYSQLMAFVQCSDREMEMAGKLIGSMTHTIDPTQYKDEYRRAVIEMVQAKLSGAIIEAPKPPEKKEVDLLGALEASLAAMEKV